MKIKIAKPRFLAGTNKDGTVADRQARQLDVAEGQVTGAARLGTVDGVSSTLLTVLADADLGGRTWFTATVGMASDGTETNALPYVPIGQLRKSNSQLKGQGFITGSITGNGNVDFPAFGGSADALGWYVSIDTPAISSRPANPAFDFQYTDVDGVVRRFPFSVIAKKRTFAFYVLPGFLVGGSSLHKAPHISGATPVVVNIKNVVDGTNGTLTSVTAITQGSLFYQQALNLLSNRTGGQ